MAIQSNSSFYGLIVSLFVSHFALGATWYASPTGSADAACTIDAPGTIQAAVDKAANGSSWDARDTVILLPGVYDYSDEAWSGKNCISVAKNKNYLKIQSEGDNPNDVIIRGRGSETYISDDLLTTNSPFYSRAFYSQSIVELSGITFTNFYNNSSGSVASSSSGRLIYLSNCIIAGNKGVGGGAIYRPAVINDCIFIGNDNTGTGGAIQCEKNSLYVTNSLFANNHASVASIASAMKGNFVNCVISNNSSKTEQGCIGYADDSVIYFENCHIVSNFSAKVGFLKVRKATFTNCLVVGNFATNGNYGVWESYAGLVTIYDSIFKGNWATNNYAIGNTASAYNSFFTGNSAYTGSGGTLYGGSVVVENCIFTNNYAGTTGGGIAFANGTAPIVRNCLFIHNYAKSKGGAMAGHPQKVYDSDFIENRAGSEGGAIEYGGSYYGCRFIRNRAPKFGATNAGYTYEDCDFIENEATGSGGAANGGTFRRCLFLRNKALENGAFSSYNSTIRNCAFIGNVAKNYGVGAGIGAGMYNCLFMENMTTGTTHGLFYYGAFFNSTFIGNSTEGKPIFGNNGNIVNCLFTENTPYDLLGNRSYINCLYGTKAASVPNMTDCIQADDPKFNMGHNPTLADYAPSRWSPARDAGLWQAWATNDVDLSSKERIKDVIDIGCFEYWPHGLQTILRVE